MRVLKVEEANVNDVAVNCNFVFCNGMVLRCQTEFQSMKPCGMPKSDDDHTSDKSSRYFKYQVMMKHVKVKGS